MSVSKNMYIYIYIYMYINICIYTHIYTYTIYTETDQIDIYSIYSIYRAQGWQQHFKVHSDIKVTYAGYSSECNDGCGAVQQSDCIRVEAVFQSGCFCLDAAQPPSRGQRREQFVCRLGGVLEDAGSSVPASGGVNVSNWW